MSNKPQRLPSGWKPTHLTWDQVAEVRAVVDDELAVKDYTPFGRFSPVERVVYFFCFCFASAVVGGIVTVVFQGLRI